MGFDVKAVMKFAKEQLDQANQVASQSNIERLRIAARKPRIPRLPQR